MQTLNPDERIRLAQKLFESYRTRCFWFMPVGYRVQADDIPLLARNLRTYGGRSGYLLAQKLCR